MAIYCWCAGAHKALELRDALEQARAELALANDVIAAARRAWAVPNPMATRANREALTALGNALAKYDARKQGG